MKETASGHVTQTDRGVSVAIRHLEGCYASKENPSSSTRATVYIDDPVKTMTETHG